jgi:hypothetical protein
MAKSTDKIMTIADCGGMYLEVHPNGSKYWRLQYRHVGKHKRISLGVYPNVSLKEAREKREELKKILQSGEDPSLVRKRRKIEIIENVNNTFENIAREWFEKNVAAMAERHAFYVIRRLEANVFPFLIGVPIKKITPKDLLAIIRKWLEKRGSVGVMED